MAKYTVIHTCGHEIVYQLYGKHVERERKIKWLSGQECFQCRRKAEEEELKAAIVGIDLPDIEGSEKQVKWAQEIRAQFVATARRYNKVDKIKPYVDFQKALSLISSVTTAKEFIDNRGKDLASLQCFLKYIYFRNKRKAKENENDIERA